jgi:hypothetical protein
VPHGATHLSNPLLLLPAMLCQPTPPKRLRYCIAPKNYRKRKRRKRKNTISAIDLKNEKNTISISGDIKKYNKNA